MIESSLSIAAWHNDMLRDLFAYELLEELELFEESELLEECLRFFFLSFLEALEGALLTLLTLVTLELASFSSSENPGFFLKAA